MGYTVDFDRRLRQHNGELVGGAKKTKKWRPWTPICVISGFMDNHEALRFEARVQHPHIGRKPKGVEYAKFVLEGLNKVINLGDGSILKDTKREWSPLTIKWYDSVLRINNSKVTHIH